MLLNNQKLSSILQQMSNTETGQLSFEVVVRRKVPYLTSFLFHVLTGLGIILVVISFFFLPAEHASLEMKTAYYILVIPQTIKGTLYFSSIGFFIVLPIYLLARLYKKALLTFQENKIIIRGKSINLDLLIDQIAKVYLRNTIAFDQFIVCFEKKDKKIIRLKLKHSVQEEEFMNRLIQYPSIDSGAYVFDNTPLEIENED
jgi:hypothetical protein